MDYSKWDHIGVSSDSDDDSEESGDERESSPAGGRRQPPAAVGAPSDATAAARPSPPAAAQASASAVLSRVTRVERLAEEVLAERRQMVELDARRQHTREAMASLRRTRTMVEKDQERLEGEIAALHRSVQQKTSELCEIDPSISGGSDVHRSFSSLHGLSLDQVAEVLPETTR
ncbi:hypothetical protein EMIHUDRAFT_237222 [Emiliania huxleyi CCMP1516]|uniref:Cdc37 N-terminal domain-containing protein n=2 Tax=Emiliania huxleyi TaxID=2903 RepID=A0A0D3JRD0_EMIH1|nr:hypothetical protein EMIHUDRAFT_237222 [Emiliania huxleyi CCMP1516]EOD26065.1 hypothetical protein EMIHUDRAFT_237222 [Emiliania huxleyi CCMP1516]|eukprot:XP_005778494.1 hypothetical protein EMIHUDRAFT_237222 [Emiliania huxleyi CCMP1516]